MDYNLIVPYIPNLRRYARALVGDRDGADDLVQDTLERAVRKFHLWKPGDLRAWLFSIMHNVFVNQLKARKIAPEVEIDEDEAELELTSADRRFSLSPEQLDRLTGVSLAAAQPYALPSTAIPRGSAFTPRVSPSYARPLAPNAVVAGIPGGNGIPVNYVGIGELRDGKVSKMTEYFANPFPAPDWRKPFVEQM